MKRTTSSELQQSVLLVPSLLFLAAIAVRCVDFGNPVINVDEQYYLMVGDRLAHGVWPYLDLWDRKPLGLFAIYAAIRLLPGDGILAYQLIATCFAAATAWLVAMAAREVGAGRWAALAAGFAYLIWLSLLGGRGGQAPVFFNLFSAGAALLTLRLPGRASSSSIVASGAAACLLAGLAIQMKYTPLFEGAYFGLAHLYFLRRAGAGLWTLGGAALLWVGLGLTPTAVAAAIYAFKGEAALHAWWFANFTSITLRRADPAALVGGRLAGIALQLAPLLLGIGIAARAGLWNATQRIVWGWLGAAAIEFVAIGTFYQHYALPLIAPLATLAALAIASRPRWTAFVIAIGVAGLITKAALLPQDRRNTAAAVAVIAANDRGQCPFVFAGDPILYHLARACTPTRYAFPAMLALANETNAQGIDDAAEVRAILARRPPVIITRDHYYGPWNGETEPLVHAALERDYRRVFAAPREGESMLIYLRRDLSLLH